MRPEELERKIRGQMGAIKRKEMSPSTSNLAGLFKALKTVDEALYEKLIQEYKTVLQSIK